MSTTTLTVFKVVVPVRGGMGGVVVRIFCLVSDSLNPDLLSSYDGSCVMVDFLLGIDVGDGQGGSLLVSA